MKTVVEGFHIEVLEEEGLPRVRVSLQNGQSIVDTNAVSVTGLERLSAVFSTASRLAAREMERYGYRLRQSGAGG